MINKLPNLTPPNSQSSQPNPIRTNIFPCKSIDLMRFLKQNGLRSEHKYKDAYDNKDCWIFLRTDELHSLLDKWAKLKSNTN